MEIAVQPSHKEVLVQKCNHGNKLHCLLHIDTRKEYGCTKRVQATHKEVQPLKQKCKHYDKNGRRGFEQVQTEELFTVIKIARVEMAFFIILLEGHQTYSVYLATISSQVYLDLSEYLITDQRSQ